ncbi:MAG: methyltransferase domain-containing protein [Acidobacteriota bacterium]
MTKTDVALPPPAVSLSQDREWCVVDVGERWKKIRFHEYDEIYAIPGLYETLFYDVLKCSSPRKVREMLQGCIHDARVAPGDLRVLDLGAGNGMVGEELARLGVRRMVGVDIIRAAAAAAHRDRQDLYDDYFVLDMTYISDHDLLRFESLELNCLTCVAALGFGDIPPAAFANAYNLIARGGWVAFNIKSDFLKSDDPCGFASLVQRMINGGLISIHARQQYEHRLATNGEPLLYAAFVGVKNHDVPAAWEL